MTTEWQRSIHRGPAHSPRTSLRGAIACQLIALWLVPAFAASVRASDGAVEQAVDEPLDEIFVRAERVDKKLEYVPGAVSVVGREEIQLGRPQLTLAESLWGMPGVFTQNRSNFAQDLRIAIRGFGARSQFGIRGIKLIIDDIPASLPDGQGQVDSLQLATTGRIEVLRGPSASLYGSAAGGVIRVESEEASEGIGVDARAAFGSYGFRSYQAKSAGRAGALGYLVGLSRQQLDGYREHSRMESNVLNSRLRWDVSSASDLTAVVSFVYSPIADDPGALNPSEVWIDRRQAAPRNRLLDAGESVNQLSGGLRFRHAFGEHHMTTAVAYSGWRQFDGRIPFDAACSEISPVPGGSAIDLGRYFGGGSIQHRYSDEYWGHANRLLVGFDVEVQRDDRKRRCNYGSSLGKRTLAQDEDVTSLRGFLQDELMLVEELELTASLGYDALRYDVLDRQPVTTGPPADPDGSGTLTFTQFSPMVGLRWSPLEEISLYSRISTSFEPPTTTELENQGGGGGFNPSLEPQRAVNYEVGVKGLMPGRLRFELVGYHIRIRDELIRYQLNGEDFYRNAGRSTRSGIEAALAYELLENTTATIAYTFSRSRFDDYIDAAGQSYAGNQVPGVPEQLLGAQLSYRKPAGPFASFELRYVGAFFADDANLVRTDSYWLSDLRLGWEIRCGGFAFTPYVGLQNLFDARYDDNVRINATGLRYFEPAAGLEVNGGLGIAYRFGGP